MSDIAEVANKICKELTGRWQIQLCIEKEKVWVELIDTYGREDLVSFGPSNAGPTIEGALYAALEHTKNDKEI